MTTITASTPVATFTFYDASAARKVLRWIRWQNPFLTTQHAPVGSFYVNTDPDTITTLWWLYILGMVTCEIVQREGLFVRKAWRLTTRGEQELVRLDAHQ